MVEFPVQTGLEQKGTKETKGMGSQAESLTYMKITEFTGGFPAPDEAAKHSKTDHAV